MSCSNNVHNIGLACINFHDTSKHFPMSISQWAEDYSRNHVGLVLQRAKWIRPMAGLATTARDGLSTYCRRWKKPRSPTRWKALKASTNPFQITGPAAGFGMGIRRFAPCSSSSFRGSLPVGSIGTASTQQWYWDIPPGNSKVITATTSYKGCIGDSVISSGRWRGCGAVPKLWFTARLSQHGRVQWTHMARHLLQSSSNQESRGRNEQDLYGRRRMW